MADFGALQVSARLSPSGAALAAAGDLRSEPLTASPGDSALRLEMPGPEQVRRAPAPARPTGAGAP
ncbi:hypothetical protein D3C80_2087130 [compost metagenome]